MRLKSSHIYGIRGILILRRGWKKNWISADAMRMSERWPAHEAFLTPERTERAIAIWIEEQVQRIPVSGYLIQEKALQFYKSMKQSEPSTSTSQAGKEFSASKGWLTGFLKRNALHNIKITGESATADEGATKIFPEELVKIIEDGDYSADQVFNADETGVYWKKLPNHTYIAKDEKTASGHKAKNESLTVKDVWKQFSIFDCLIHVASASAQIRPRTLNACWKKIWPACVTDNTTTQTSTLSDEIINLAHEIGGDGFNTSSLDDIDELLVEDALSDNDIIDLTLDLTVAGVVGLEGDNDEEEKSTPLTGKLIQEDLRLCSKLKNHFLINDPNSERASKLQRDLQNCMSGYRELYKKIKESSSRSLITDYIVRKGRATQNENEVCENPWPLPQISIAETVSSDDGDLEPLRKRCKPLSGSDND
ncbi:tigger transposable element-derived protein 1 [Trichonephila clavipes]|uniref:Tigger transposable element-derived protein 1 n=1 Tax=Trichonephila clavipes TaxID=2585209 RepID=A0A8X6VML5_TRICX|nr:tigger transposable element-derived protein 1 [Trichonephila clavipes]